MYKNKDIYKIENRVELIQGIFFSPKGKYTNIQLQHESKKLWIKEQTINMKLGYTKIRLEGKSKKG